MLVKPRAFKLIGVALILVLALSAIRLVAAQSDEAVQDDQRPLLGVSIVPVEEGARVVRVLPDGPADEAGLKVGDILPQSTGKR
jgi:S1-C subfamily serine protease